ncbi:MAG: type II toxin-antitoxin system HicA family toxin [Patescibacteria group bacterium]
MVSIFESFGFYIVGQKGSHLKLRKDKDELKYTLTIPNHFELGKGATKAIYNQGLKYIPEIELRKYFYNN